jgi:hypothetical protein
VHDGRKHAPALLQQPLKHAGAVGAARGVDGTVAHSCFFFCPAMAVGLGWRRWALRLLVAAALVVLLAARTAHTLLLYCG